ncbi:DUF4212 domain-containing protein [Pararhodospirillum oryzae]|nr:DUF4212 domain-containing protein [Pararhodospirillum oryzae]
MNDPSGTAAAHWRATLRLVTVCLGVWAGVALGCSVIFAEQLDAIELGGFRLGFWFAQQGSMVLFVLVVFFHAWGMNEIDRAFDVDED